MLKVYRPSKNNLTQGYKNTHKAYDFSGRGDQGVYASIDGEIIEVKDGVTGNWIATPPLKTADYGNYIKIKGRDLIQLVAHLKVNTSLPKGTMVVVGGQIAKIGNTGNSTAPHLHAEYRTLDNKNTPVEFFETLEEEEVEEKVITDQTTYDFGGNLGVLEMQVVRSQLNDLRKDNTNFVAQIKELDNEVELLKKQLTEKPTEIIKEVIVDQSKPIDFSTAVKVIFQYFKNLWGSST